MLTPVSFMRKRSAIVLMVILCILGAAFSIYYFHYVPGNRQRLHRYGFTTLERISENIIARNKDLAQLFSNERLVTRALANIGGECVADNTTTPGLTADHRFSYRRDKDSLCKVNTKAVLSPILSFRHELFSHYLLLYKTGSSTTLAYADDGLGADAQVAADSLGALTNRHPFAQISTVSLNGETYQLFTHPFLLGEQQMVLCGLVPNSNYDSRLRDIPISFIYPLVILLIFVLICLPFARVYLIGRGERTGFGDALGIAVSVFIGMALTATIVIQVLLLSSGNQRAEAQMATLSDSIKHDFHAELQLMYNKLKAIDQLPDSLLRSQRGTAPYTITVANKGTLRHYRDPLPGFFNYDRVFWGDREGRQAIFANSGWGANVSSNVNLNDRQYYRYFRLREPSSEEADFWVETVNSWALGDFRLNMAIRSRRPDMVTAVMSSRMYSVTNVIMPPGYQFCLINAEGDVILHSQEARSLKENILEESGNSRELREAISSRQNAKIRNIQCYGANHTLFIHALSGLPYYLVILHDSNYIVPLNMRILLFALMFTTLLCAFILGMLFLLRSGTLRISWLFPVMRYFSWAVPRPSMLRLYDFGSIFLLIYMLLLLFPNIHSDPGRQFSNDHTTLVLVMLAPINAMLVLHVYRLRYWSRRAAVPANAAAAAVIFYGRWFLVSCVHA
ncbi:hypothetical protein MKQ70_35635 [Chitinophaga sedimenti]|uniref:hypothetical protein n=1 Tax=Chitinophaga sedimenti TaxID=2033606 RepID=UPI0020030B9E|nr:hypothetical protein [Chitinophaga sedimenti]MCK7559976.1 hypothetical protein [Chitinophaga sedimenti]